MTLDELKQAIAGWDSIREANKDTSSSMRAITELAATGGIAEAKLKAIRRCIQAAINDPHYIDPDDILEILTL